MEASKYKIADLSKRMFWDVDVDSLEWTSHRAFILERIMAYGTLDDWRIVKKVYGLVLIKNTVLELRNLDDFSISFLSVVFSISKEKFRCYIQKQSSPNFWNY